MIKSMKQPDGFSRIGFLIITTITILSVGYIKSFSPLTLVLIIWIPCLIGFFLEDRFKKSTLSAPEEKS